MKPNIYIAGPITGKPGASDIFGEYAAMLRERGWNVFSPPEFVDTDTEWSEAMVLRLNTLLHCDYIYFMPGWLDEVGCFLEHIFCLKRGIKIYYDIAEVQVC